MRIDTKEYCYNVQVTVNNKDNVKWLLLHGFMGSHHDFDQIIRRLPGQVLTIDLLGFGDKMPTVAPEQFRMSNQIDDLVHILKQLDWHDIKLLGYSMGGRLALGFAISHPYLVHQLYLESATAGLKTPQQRDVRCQADFQKAEQIEDNFADFVASWEKMPLFSTQQNVTVAQKKFMHEQRINQNPINVANSLRYMGTGVQKNYWPNLKTLDIPTQLIVGELDNKFIDIAQNMLTLLPNALLTITQNAGHNVHFEQPAKFVEVLHVSNKKN